MKKRLFAGATAALCCAGLAIAQPANDECANAQALSIPSITNGTLVGAVPECGPPPTCTTSYAGTPAVWYTVVGNGDTLTIDLCSTAVSFDTKLHVYCTASATPCSTVAAFSCVGGNDDGGAGCGTASPVRLSKVTFCSALGQTYYIMVSMFFLTTPLSPFTITVTDGAPCTTAVPCTGTALGACCNNPTQICTMVAGTSCTAGTFQGVGSTCTCVSPCPGVGACCSTGGLCSIVLPASCAGATQTYFGVGTVCLPADPCTPLLGACCNNTSGVCLTITVNGCSATTSTFQGVGTVCGVNLCPGTGACCDNATGECTLTLPGGCSATTSTFRGAGLACAPNPCNPTGACCSETGTCTTTTIAGCAATRSFRGVGTTCSPSPCAALLGACCTNGPAPVCILRIANGCTGFFTFLGTGSVCGPSPCPALVGACCSSAGGCGLTTGPGCIGTNTFLGAGTTCSPNPCVALLGACCSSAGICTLTTEAGCTGTSMFLGVGWTCSPSSCTALLGACCGTGSAPLCVVLAASGCTETSTFLGTGSVCNPWPCSALVGACCTATGVCGLTTARDCTGTSGFQGVGTVCTLINPCTGLLGTCCDNTTGICTFTTQLGCGTTGAWINGGSCSPNPCPPNGACCFGSCCTPLLASICTSSGGAYQGNGSVCMTNPCPAPANDLCSGAIPVTAGVSVSGGNCNATSTGDGPAASCVSASNKGLWYAFASPGGRFDISTCGSPHDTVLTVFTSPDCINFTQVPSGCDDDSCDDFNPPGSGFASFINHLPLPVGNYLIRVSSFGSNPTGNKFTLLVSAAVTGACCDGATGTCSLAEPGACPSGTNYQGDGTVCGPNPCLPPAGACCCGSSCSLTTAAACAGTNSVFSGSGTVCNVAGNISSPCCLADYNHAGGVSVQDIFDFLSGYFSGNPCADINGGGLSVQDIFDFLAAFFAAGC